MSTYQLPPDSIKSLADFEPAPLISISHDASFALLQYRSLYKTVEDLGKSEVKLAGVRVNPDTYTVSNISFKHKITFLDIATKQEKSIAGFPTEGKFSHLTFNRSQSLAALLSHEESGAALWVIDIKALRAWQLTAPKVNACMGAIFIWGPNDDFLYVKMRLEDEKPILKPNDITPKGPIVFENEEGLLGQNRTYQDLLQNESDELNFTNLVTSRLSKVYLDGTVEDMLEPAIYESMSVSPDKKYFMVSVIHPPYSYMVPFQRFDTKYELYNSDGTWIKQIANQPLCETLPKGFMAVPDHPRSISWRSDQPATLVWVNALDGGDPEKQVEFRDEIVQCKAPFDDLPELIFRTKLRFHSIAWGDDTRAIVEDYWFSDRLMRTILIDPSDLAKGGVLLHEGNYQDKYNDPGDFKFARNSYGLYTLDLLGNEVILIGDGYGPDRKRPFIDTLDLITLKKSRILVLDEPDIQEDIIHTGLMNEGRLITMRQSSTLFPNFYFRDINTQSVTAITSYENPFLLLQNVKKRIVQYKRQDGLDLAATVYLPIDYDTRKKYPMIMWAYPEDHKDKQIASQITQYKDTFSYPFWGSPLYWLTRGYVVMDDVSFPILGEGEALPNDSYITQLVANAKAAIDYVGLQGWVDRHRVAVGGHSYGAFMVANLLTHSDLFAAGIARSGAYNRTLTPFGFQTEERNLWDAKDIYRQMSPFEHADLMKTPLLLIHGEKDENTGTFTMQSERYYNALKSLGAPVRYVVLPRETHGYTAKENIMHMLWEQDEWLEKFVKNRT